MKLILSIAVALAIQVLLVVVGVALMLPMGDGRPLPAAYARTVEAVMVGQGLALLVGVCLILAKYWRDTLRLRAVHAELEASSARHLDFARASSDLFWEVGADGTFTYVADHSGVYQGMFGVRVGTNIADIVARDPITPRGVWARQLVSNQNGYPFRDFNHSVQRACGGISHFRSSGVPVFDAAGELRGMRGSTRDQTAEVEAQQLQALQRAVLQTLVEDQPLAAIADTLCRQVEAMVPGVVCSMLRVEGGVLRPLAGPSLPEPYSRALDGLRIGPAAGSCGTAAHRGEPVLTVDIRADPLWERFDYLPLPEELKACWSSPIKLQDGRVAATFAFYYRENRGPDGWNRRIVDACVHLCALAIERFEAQMHIEHLAYFDTLTGLPNRRHMTSQIGQLIALSGAARQPLALLFLDIDRFKDINDTLGHHAGDQLLVEVANRLRHHIGPQDLVGRLSGDEFVIACSDCDAATASIVAHRTLRELAEPFALVGMSLPISVSAGISVFPEDGADVETLLRHADTAMYEAKSSGRGIIRLFGPEMKQAAQNRLIYGAALRGAVGRGELRLRYQPQIRLSDGKLYGFEALARWSHPQLGAVPPGTFVPIAEETGLIGEIGLWALDAACRQVAEWQAEGLAVPAVSVNLSPLHFHDSTLPQTVLALLQRYGLRSEMLTLEMTEGVMMDSHPATLETVAALRNLGVGLSMDDFGSGYSSLSRLAQMPVSELKIDQSFMRGLESDLNTQAIVTAIIRIGESLGMQVVGEGVETAAQIDMLRALGCPVGQGFLFSEPLAADDVTGWMAEELITPVLPRPARARPAAPQLPREASKPAALRTMAPSRASRAGDPALGRTSRD